MASKEVKTLREIYDDAFKRHQEKQAQPNRRKWKEFKNFQVLSEFSDPAEAEFEVRLSTGVVIKDCYYAEIKDAAGDPYITFCTKDDAPITRMCITHYRRQS